MLWFIESPQHSLQPEIAITMKPWEQIKGALHGCMLFDEGMEEEEDWGGELALLQVNRGLRWESQELRWCYAEVAGVGERCGARKWAVRGLGA
jgi:hypothetical protein